MAKTTQFSSPAVINEVDNNLTASKLETSVFMNELIMISNAIANFNTAIGRLNSSISNLSELSNECANLCGEKEKIIRKE